MKVGDIVICIDTTDRPIGSASTLLSIGKIYTITAYKEGISDKIDSTRVKVTNDDGSTNWWYGKRFKLSTEFRKQKLNKLNEKIY